MREVLVIGGGMAGTLAALSAAAQGAQVTLCSRSYGATALSTGALDIAYSPAFASQGHSRRTLLDHVQDIANHRPRHPYGLLGMAQTQRCLLGGYQLLQAALQGSGLDLPALDLQAKNGTWASSLGTLMPAAAAFAPHGEGQPSAEPGRVAVLGLAGDPNFCAPRVSLGLQHDATAHGLPVTFSALEVHLPGLDDLTRTSPLALAKAFDDMALAQHLAQQLRGRLQGISTLLTPPVLGLQRFAATRDYLCTALGIPVVEALGHMPTVPGFRLQQALEAAVQRAGVRCLGAVQALQLQGSAEKETASSAAGPLSCAIADGQTLRPDALVLCTGRFIAGGLLFKGRCTEPLLDLPVVTEMGRLEVDSPHSVVRPTPSESHPLMTAGVQVNRRLQPLRDGQVAHPSLFAAGMLLSGFASRFALCADGVALCTGFLAGSLAAEAVPS